MAYHDKVRFNVGIAGFLECCDTSDVLKRISAILQEIRRLVSDNEKRIYGTDTDDICIDLYTCPYFADERWAEICGAVRMGLNIVFPTNDVVPKAYVMASASTANIDISGSLVAVMDSMTSWVTSQIDVALVAWDGKESSHDGYIWGFIRECKKNHTPCIWINTTDLQKMYWVEHAYFEVFDEGKLKRHVDLLFEVPEAAGKEDRPFLSGVWEVLYNRYLAKHPVVQSNPPDGSDGERVTDVLLEPGHTAFEDKLQHGNYERMREYYLRFDQEAVRLSKKFRASMYFRSVLPFISTLFVAVGFYVETILGAITTVSICGLQVWTVLAGIGFLMSAAVNLYGYWMSQNTSVREYRSQFLQKRYIAEYLRIALHLLPYGIVVNEAPLNEAIKNQEAHNRTAVIMIRRIIRRSVPVDCVLDQAAYRELLDNLSLMVKEQIAYHQKTAARLGSIATKLSRYNVAIFWIGFTLVMARGGLQFALAVIGNDVKDNWPKLNGENINVVMRSFSNLLALTIPAWALYFSQKSDMNNFSGLARHSKETARNLGTLSQNIDEIKSQNTIQYEALYSLAEDVLRHQVAEVSVWYAQTTARSVTKL